MKKLRFLRDTTVDFRTFEKDDEPNVWFSDEQAARHVEAGDAEIVEDAVWKGEKSTTPDSAPAKLPEFR